MAENESDLFATWGTIEIPGLREWANSLAAGVDFSGLREALCSVSLEVSAAIKRLSEGILERGTFTGDLMIILDTNDESEREAAIDRMLEHASYDVVLGDYVNSPYTKQQLRAQWREILRPALRELRRERMAPDRPVREQLLLLLLIEYSKAAGLLALGKPAVKEQTLGPKQGPTPKTEERALLYREIKTEHPDWSYGMVAMEANERQNADYHTDETVRNAYRKMKWTWERANRIR